ncbi:MAG: DUF1460 domain-containing protein [Bacteroidia bacterium]|nr:DUF1460 domain-containing protein [Bacteroidia bacterium]MDW8014677.1 DUF1460 domain-containing protein [Bacteroidia bacterium]
MGLRLLGSCIGLSLLTSSTKLNLLWSFPVGEKVDTPAFAQLLLPPVKIVGSSLQRVRHALALHSGRSYPGWAREIARQWQGLPYGSGGKGLGPQELLLNLEQMDCMTAVENLMALHLTHQHQTSSIQDFIRFLSEVRYQALPPCRWEDRYHYLTHAFIEWEEKGWGSWLPFGSPESREVFYITKHRKNYSGFSDWHFIKAIEARLSSHPRYCISSERIGEWLPFLQDGDLIAFVSSEEGLDVSHVGVFFWEKDRPTFAHASLRAKKWVYGEDLCAYLDRRKSKIKGICVFRPF